MPATMFFWNSEITHFPGHPLMVVSVLFPQSNYHGKIIRYWKIISVYMKYVGNMKEWIASFCYDCILFPLGTRWKHVYSLLHLIILSQSSKKYFSTWSSKHLIMMMTRLSYDWPTKKVFSHISSQNHCQRSSPSQISDMLRVGFEPT